LESLFKMNLAKDLIKPILALIVVLCSFVYFFVCLFTDHKPDPQIIIAIVACQQIPLSYYFGNSSGNATKDSTIATLTDNASKN